MRMTATFIILSVSELFFHRVRVGLGSLMHLLTVRKELLYYIRTKSGTFGVL